MTGLRMIWRQFRRDLAAGEVRLLLAALMLAVMAVSSVGFLADRAERALAMEANRLLGGDAVLRSDSPLSETPRQAARSVGLDLAETVEFSSMVRAQDRLLLGDIKGLGEGFPLRGEFLLLAADGRSDQRAGDVPEPGTVWLSRAGAEALQAKLGDRIGIGASEFRLTALVSQEPDAALDYFKVAPKLFLNLSDLPATQLIQPGSRVGYRLVVAGDAAAVEGWSRQMRADLVRGQRLETAADARPEIRQALKRAGQFLGMAAMIAVILAAIAVAMAARRHSARQLPSAAVMRCLGASQARLVTVLLGEMLVLGLLGSTLGLLLAYSLQFGIGEWLMQRMKLDIPPASWAPAWEGLAVGMTVLLAFAAPPVLALRRVPALRVLRRDLDPTEPSAWLVGLLGLSGLAALLWWKSGSASMGAAMLGGVTITLLILAGVAALLIVVLRLTRSGLRGPWRYGLANVARRPASSVAQIAALGLGIMVLLLLGFVRTDLLERWRSAMPDDAPNRFIVNVQPDQVAPLEAFLISEGVSEPELFPMVRGRWTQLNGEPVSLEKLGKGTLPERSRRLAEREFNLSTAVSLGDSNRVIEGAFWSGTPAQPELSVEVELAKNLGWALGDVVRFDIAGQPLQARITSLREVDWESFRPNFFVLVSPGVLEGHAASHITAVRIKRDNVDFTSQLVQRFPNLSVIDVDAVLEQVRSTVDQVSMVVEAVFLFSLAAGVLVLVAAVQASQDERLLEGGVMRVLGGSRRQLRMAHALEFGAIGLLSGGTAALAATVLSGIIAEQVLELPWQADWKMAAVGGAIGAMAALIAGMLATRRVVTVAPSVTLRELPN